jgi:hypothetical protein
MRVLMALYHGMFRRASVLRSVCAPGANLMNAVICRTLSLCCIAVLVLGCATPAALERQTVYQADTATDIHQQQVLDNLAKFLSDPYSVPSFSLATQGTNDVTDNHAGNFALGWGRTAQGNFLFNSLNSMASGSRTKKQNWTMTPIANPRKLELMRCAYQRTLTNCGVHDCESQNCPDCRKRFNQFYTGRAFATKTLCDDGKLICNVEPDLAPQTCYRCDDDGRLANLVSPPFDDSCVCNSCGCQPTPSLAQLEGTEQLPLAPVPDASRATQPKVNCDTDCPRPGSGTVNSECLTCDGNRWFCWSCNKKNVPECCTPVGEYCGLYVWVPQGPGRNELAKLTLAILDFAVHDSAQLPKKEVYAFLAEDLTSTTYSNAAFLIKAEIGVAEPSESVVAADVNKRLSEAACIERRKVINDAIKALGLDCEEVQSAYDNRAPGETIVEVLSRLALNQELSNLGVQEELPSGTMNFSMRAMRDSVPEIQSLPEESQTELNNVRTSITLQTQQLHERLRQLQSELNAIPLPEPNVGQRTPTPGAGLLELQQQLETVR